MPENVIFLLKFEHCLLVLSLFYKFIIAPLYIVFSFCQNQFFIFPGHTTTSIDLKLLAEGVHFYSRPNAKNLKSIAGLDQSLELDKWWQHLGSGFWVLGSGNLVCDVTQERNYGSDSNLLLSLPAML